MKAIIPVAGFGTRLRPHTLTRAKCLLHVAGRPILAHILDELVSAGIRRVVLVYGYLGDQIISWVREHYSLDVHFVEQTEPLGNGHAVYVAREYLDEEPTVLLFGDTIVRAHLAEVMRREETTAGVKPVDDPRRFGIAQTDERGYVTRLVEKPEHPVGNLALVGFYLIRNSPLLRAALERMVREDRRMRGEFWLADALQLMLDAGERMRTFPITHWYDCGTVEALLKANHDLLDMDAPAVPHLTDSVVIPPSAVDARARISRSVIGPYASVAAGATIVGSVVRDSIIHPEATVEGALLTGSVVGERAKITGAGSDAGEATKADRG